VSREREAQVRAIGEDVDAFERFYREHVEAVERFVARRVADPALAADLTADVFLASIDAAESYDARRGAPVAWLFGIARNVVAGERRRQAVERRAVGRFQGRELLDEDDVAALVQRIDAASAARELYGALASLTETERAVLELVALDGLSVGETARALGIGPVAARVRLHRARRQLAGELSGSSLRFSEVREVS
jgi:RNA polymerase sigma-70 factor (ECF subfamily)